MSILPLGGRGSFDTEITRGGGWGGRRRGKAQGVNIECRRGKMQGCKHKVQIQSTSLH